MTSEKSKNKGSIDQSLVVGILLAVFGGGIAIGVSVWFSKSPDPLWAIFLLIWGLERVRGTRREYAWKPAVLGLVIGLAYAALGVAAYYLNNTSVLWAMILVNWLADAII